MKNYHENEAWARRLLSNTKGVKIEDFNEDLRACNGRVTIKENLVAGLTFWSAVDCMKGLGYVVARGA